MTKRKAAQKTVKKRTLPPAAEPHKFKPGNKAAVGHGRPRTLSELRELIQSIGSEQIQGADLTRLDLLLRGMYASRNASDRLTLLKYGWGNVPEEIRGAWQDELETMLLSGQLTLQDAIEVIQDGSLVAEFFKRPRLQHLDYRQGQGEGSAQTDSSAAD